MMVKTSTGQSLKVWLTVLPDKAEFSDTAARHRPARRALAKDLRLFLTEQAALKTLDLAVRNLDEYRGPERSGPKVRSGNKHL